MTYITQILSEVGTFNIPLWDRNPNEWAIVTGYVAPIQGWEMPTEICDEIISGLSTAAGIDREVTLIMGDPQGTLQIERVYVVGSAPADNPQRSILLLTDIRWYLGLQIFIVDVNVRRRLGDKRLLSEGNLQNSIVADSVAYAPWSINKNTAHTWTSQKDQTLQYLANPIHGRPAFLYTTDGLSLNIPTQTVQELVSDSTGDVGLARTIESLPGAGIYVDLQGVMHVYDALPGAEKTFIETYISHALWEHGTLKFVDLSGLRPYTYRMYVDYAIEMRFNYRSATETALDQMLDLENVIQVTDRSLNIPAGVWGPARTVAMGTWITLDEAFAAWGPKTIATLNLPQLTDDIVADHWFGDALEGRYTLGSAFGDLDPIWVSRIEALMRSYRTIFRINHKTWDKLRHVWNVRAAVWDPITGTRAPSPVYSNYHCMTLDEFVSSKIEVYGHNEMTSYPYTGNLKDGHPSGFDVTIIDPELMIIAIERNTLKFPGQTRIAPSPTIDGVTTTGGAGANEAVLQRLQHKGEWFLSIVLTVSPASPNDRRRLYEVKVDLPDILTAVGGLVANPACNAPDREIRTHMTEARVAWDDNDPNYTNILKTIGGTDDGQIGTNDPVQLTPINLTSELKPLAAAIAASDFVSRLDHYEGIQAVPMAGGIVPLGSIFKIVHKVTTDRAVSIIHCGAPSQAPDPIDFLRGSARSYLLKEIQTQR
jgi:hypothetical protein